jgi:DNA-binding Lrp family transcriptional regulator
MKRVKQKGIYMKDVELKLISELMKNSRRSDRELAKTIGVSQPTVSRLIRKLEKNGYIQEYTMIPNLEKLGYQIMALIFVKHKELSSDDFLKARTVAQHDFRNAPTEIILFERGIGEEHTGVIISFHKDYASYTKLASRTRQYPFLEHVATKSFLINLKEEVHYRPLTLKTLAENILSQKES